MGSRSVEGDSRIEVEMPSPGHTAITMQSSPGPIAQSATGKQGLALSWRQITYQVVTAKKETKVLLNGVTGEAPPSEFFFIMGPSGSGKSTFLDAMAGRLAGTVEGQTLVDGRRLDEAAFKRVSKYVQQEDILTPILTVEETLQYSAGFYTTDRDVIKNRVNDAIAMLGLENQRNTIVGNIILRGLSGGQKRRLSVGNELVAQPGILFMDELTSGLDSTAAAHVMESLSKVAKNQGCTMMLTIHQPAETLYQMADSLMLLSGGRVAYCGHAAKAVEHFKSLGRPIPPMTSSSEYLLDLVNADFSDKATVAGMLDAWAASPAADTITKSVAAAPSVFASLPSVESKYGFKPGDPPHSTSFFNQTAALTRRGFLNAWRNPLVVWLRLAMYVALSIMIGTVWLRIGNKSDVVVDIVGVLFFVAAFMVFMSVSVLPAFLEEKAVFVRERANGAYGVMPFVVAHTIVDAPFMFLQSLVCGGIVYWLVGLNAAADRFFFFILDLFLSFMVAESIMMLVSAVVPVAIVGIALGAMIYGAFMVVQGFFIKLENIGWWWRWMHWIGMHSYSFSAFMYNEFHERQFDPAPNASGGPQPGISGDVILEMYDFHDTDKWTNMLVLAAMAVIYRFLAALVMQYYHTGKK